MNIVDLIIKKRNGGELTTDEINYFIKGVTDKSLPDYQISAMLMAIFFRSLSPQETADLTLAMVHSGTTLDLSEINGIKVDKHSTGGVADTTTLILAPLVASLGLKVIKMSGRGLGHSGGTVDKLESIPGYNTDLSTQQAIKQVNNIGLAIIGQTSDLTPADKYLYALRDVTGTVDSIPLIASSIMSKKLAGGSDAIVLDVKVGNGAFMQDITQARQLAKAMVEIGNSLNKKTVALITAMDRPLGNNIGNSLEVEEAINVLKGKVKGRLKDVVLELGAHMLILGKITNNLETARNMLNENIANGKGLDKFKELITAQGGNPHVCDDLSLLPQPTEKFTVTAKKSGIISQMDTAKIGRASVALGAGRTYKGEKIDLSAGIIMNKTVGDIVQQGDKIAELYASDIDKCNIAADILNESIEISNVEKKPLPTILEVIE